MATSANTRARDLTLNVANVFVTAVVAILGLRFILRLFGASTGNDFVDWVYEISEPLLAPFRGIFPTKVFESQYVLELSTLFAILIYMLFGLFVFMLVDTLAPAKGRKK